MENQYLFQIDLVWIIVCSTHWLKCELDSAHKNETENRLFRFLCNIYQILFLINSNSCILQKNSVLKTLLLLYMQFPAMCWTRPDGSIIENIWVKQYAIDANKSAYIYPQSLMFCYYFIYFYQN